MFDLELDSSLYFHEGNIDTRFYLVEKDSIDMKSDNTPLMSAAQKGHANIVKLLLNHGANKDLISLRSGKTALEMAEENNHAESAILLCSKKFTHYQESTATVIDKLEKHPHKIKHAANSHALTEKKTAALTSQIVEAINPQDELPHALSRRHTYK